jgi:hypothetical protein
VAVALSVGNRIKRQGRTEVFWAVDRVDRYRLCAELVQVAGHVVIVCRSQADASRVAGELSRHGVPAASVEHRDFAASRIRAQVVTDETALTCNRNEAVCVIQFDPAGGPRRYRRRLDLLATRRAFVATLVVPEREADTRELLRHLDLPDVISGADLAVARRAIELAHADVAEAAATKAHAADHHDDASGAASFDRNDGSGRHVLARLTGHARGAFGAAGRLVRGRGDDVTTRLRSASGDETTIHRDQRAS